MGEQREEVGTIERTYRLGEEASGSWNSGLQGAPTAWLLVIPSKLREGLCRDETDDIDEWLLLD